MKTGRIPKVIGDKILAQLSEMNWGGSNEARIL